MTIQQAISYLEGILCGAEPLETDIDDIINLLREQEPVEPDELVDDFYPIGDPLRTIGWQCGYCGERIAGYDSFCPNCGRKVKWE